MHGQYFRDYFQLHSCVNDSFVSKYVFLLVTFVALCPLSKYVLQSRLSNDSDRFKLLI